MGVGGQVELKMQWQVAVLLEWGGGGVAGARVTHEGLQMNVL